MTSRLDATPRYLNEAALDPSPESSWGKLLALVPRGSRVLDVGCGYGAFAAALARHRLCTVVGVEPVAEAAAVARARCQAVHVGAVEEVLRGGALPSDFDLAIASDVLEHLPDPAAVLRQLALLLKPGGAVLASVPNVTHLSVVLALAEGRFPRGREGLLDATHVQFFGEQDVLDLFASAGYAARIRDRVVIEPRFTEFRTDLSPVPVEAMAFLGRNPNARTYQFIVRAVPLAWATPGDREPEHRGAADTAPDSRPVSVEPAPASAPAAVPVSVEPRASPWLLGDRLAARARADAFPTLRVLYVADRADAPFRYRCLNACEQLRASGAVANVARVGDPGLLDNVASYSVIVLFRLPWSSPVAALVARAREAGAAVAFDVDDLVFDPATEADLSFFRRLDPGARERYRDTFTALGQTLRASDFCIAATETIARRARAFGVPAFVHPNLLSRTHVRMARVIRPLRRTLEHPLVGYLSGSDTHDGDLRSVEGPLARFLETHPDFSFLLVGFAELPERLASLADRVVRFPYTDFRAYPWLLARCRAVIAPIERIGDFTNAKSALKVFEAGILGVPAVASPTLPYRAAIVHGVSGFLPATADEWTEALEAVADRARNAQLGEAALTIAREEHSPQAWRGVLASRLAERAGHASGPVPFLRPLSAEPDSKLERFISVARAARQMLQCARGRPPGPGPAWARRVEILGPDAAIAADVAAAAREGDRLVLDGRPLGWVLADRERPLPRLDPEGAALASASGATTGTMAPLRTAGAGFVVPANGWDLSGVRFLVLQMRAQAEVPDAQGALLWRTREEEGFSSHRGVLFSVAADAQMRTYVVPLRKREIPPAVHSLRLQPLTRAGTLEVPLAVLLDWRPDLGRQRSRDLRRALAERFLRGHGIEVGALQNPLPMPSGASVRYVDRLSLAEARAHYPELEGQPLVEPTIVAEADRLTPLPTASQDFVVANHVLEHLRDPIGALREWIRVLRPGGHLYVAVPDHDNPLDRLRPVTSFDHLLADHAAGPRETEDREHFLEWARSTRPGLSEADHRTLARQLADQAYAIHFHALDRAVYDRLLSHVCPQMGAAVVELQTHAQDGSVEHMAVVRRDREPASRGGTAGVDVVIPVYNAREYTSRCVESVLRHATGDWRLILVDDCSTEPGLADDLAAFARKEPRVLHLRNEQNLGFTATANRGMREAGRRDVLLLNSDTEVFEGFLDRLRAAAYADERTGVLTPFSNNATICSIPEFARDNAIPQGYTAEGFARLVAACSSQVRPDIVTGVGFCMYVKAAVLERVGLFDEETFGRGYGEENDLCERARKAGFRIQLCDDVFVYHKGKASFGGEGQGAENGPNAALLEAKHPGYHAAVERFVRTNPLAPLHDVVRFHLRRLGRGSETALAFVVHASPFAPNAGGTEHFVRDLVAGLRLPRAVVLFPSAAGVGAAEVLNGDVAQPILYDFPVDRHAAGEGSGPVVEQVLRLARLFQIRAAHVHHLMSWPLDLPLALGREGIPCVLSHHDYFAVCPNWNLYDHEAQRPCDCALDAASPGAGCLPAFYRMLGAPPPAGDLGELRRAHRIAFAEAMRHAERNVFPSGSARDLVLGHFSQREVRAEVIEHGLDTGRRAGRKAPGERLRVAVAGEVAYPTKGAERYLELLAATRALPLEWHLFGDVRPFGFESRLEALGLRDQLVRHGRYRREELPDLLAAEGIDLCAILPDVHETFSFVLSEALIAGVPVLASRRGALVERISRDQVGWLVDDPREAAGLLGLICADRSRLDGPTQRARRFRHRSVAENAGDHRTLYADLGWLPEPDVPAVLDREHLRELYARGSSPPPPAAAVEDDAVSSWLVRAGLYHRLRRLKSLFPSWLWHLGREVIRPAGRTRLLEGLRKAFHR